MGTQYCDYCDEGIAWDDELSFEYEREDYTWESVIVHYYCMDDYADMFRVRPCNLCDEVIMLDRETPVGGSHPDCDADYQESRKENV